ncbi:hypothetical protein OIU84_021783 [Salix udensis]|uniref:Uncharacterized protein n=1 Tax=Salix udensis TaxID=889485 RepID=A0AAD6PJD6_9ROSI|nr:hypothetical protein OIU84_021783 [Salix udensis]
MFFGGKRGEWSWSWSSTGVAVVEDSSEESSVLTEIVGLLPDGPTLFLVLFSAMLPNVTMAVCLLTISEGRLICMVACALVLSQLGWEVVMGRGFSVGEGFAGWLVVASFAGE